MNGIYPTFLATDDDGTQHTLRLVPGVRGVATPDDPLGRIPGPKRIVTEDGQAVERIARGEFVIVSTGVRLSSTDEDAP